MTKKLESEVLDAVEQIRIETGVSKDIVFDAIEQAFAEGAKNKYGQKDNIYSIFDRSSGRVRMYRTLIVVDEVNDRSYEIDLESANKVYSNAVIGSKIEEALPEIKFDRIIAQRMSSIILGNIKTAEKDREYNDYLDRIGDLVTGVVKRIAAREALVWIGKSEASLSLRNTLPNERLNVGDKIIASIKDVIRDDSKPQIILSRTSNEFLSVIMSNEIPELNDGVIKILAVAREPGFKSKVAVYSSDSRLDPVGACIGPKGSRVKSVMEQLKGERIDIIEYSENPAVLIEKCLAPAKVVSININDKTKSADVVVTDDTLSFAIGRRGQNVRLTSKISNYKIDIIADSQKKQASVEKFNAAVQKIAEAIDLDEVAAQIIVASGFTNVHSIADSAPEEIAKIEGFDLETAHILYDRAKEFIGELEEKGKVKLKDLGVHQDMLELPILRIEMLVKLAENDIKSIKDVADLSDIELCEILGDVISEDDAGTLIMIARRYIYDI